MNGALEEKQPLRWAFLISLAGHLLLVGVILFKPQWDPSISGMPSVISVRMVDLSTLADKAPPKGRERKTPTVQEPPAKPEKTAPIEEQKEDKPALKPEKEENKPEISVADKKSKPKTALKYQTYKPRQVIKKAVTKIEKQVSDTPPRQFEETIKRLRDQVEKDEKNSKAGANAGEEKGAGVGRGFFASGSKEEAEAIDLYHLEVGYMVQGNWAFSEQLAGRDNKLMASIAFKVLPDGKIIDIFFTDHSGNAYLDDSAYKAIVKSSPVKPHPAGLAMPYVHMGLRFTPEGVER